MALLEVEALTKRFSGLVAVDRLSFRVEPGEIVGLIGPNGAGKTTTFNLICGLLRPDGGRVLFRSRDVTRWPPHLRCHIGMGRTFQIVQPFDGLTVVENVMVGCCFGAERLPPARARQKALELCRLVGLGGQEDRVPGDLTLADQKKLEVARALAASPRLLLLDEVMQGLTAVESREACQVVRRVREAGVTVLLIEHVMSTVRDLCDRVVVMHYGRKLVEGTYAEVSSHPEVLAAYLGEEGADREDA